MKSLANGFGSSRLLSTAALGHFIKFSGFAEARMTQQLRGDEAAVRADLRRGVIQRG